MYKILYIGRPIESIVQVLKESASLDLLGYILDKNLPENKRVCQELFYTKFLTHPRNLKSLFLWEYLVLLLICMRMVLCL